MNDTDALEPRAVWRIFAAINRIPRMSGHEAAVQEMLETRARGLGHGTKRDAVGNLLILVPATRGKEGAPAVLLQGHTDMVCEANAGTVHDFLKDPIIPVVRGEWVTASGTTLGADNAIGVAMALAAAEDPAVVHGPLEILLTVDEEVGLRGAAEVEPGFFSAQLGLNLDSEDETSVTVSCAGMQESKLTVRGAPSAVPAGWAVREVAVTGLVGGHSGIDIHKNHANAIRILARALLASDGGAGIRLVRIEGGNKRNAIPREARATIAVPAGRVAAVEAAAAALADSVRREEAAGVDPGLAVTFSPAAGGAAWSAADSARVLHLLAAIPHGVTAMSSQVDGLVESSTNLAVVESDAGAVHVLCTSRSSVMSSLEQVALQHRALAALAGAQCEQGPRTPGWQPDPSSRVLAAVRESFRAVFGAEPRVTGIHAGLECGVLRERSPGLDMVSFGPDIRGAHSPDERVRIASVQNVYRLLGDVLGRLAGR